MAIVGSKYAWPVRPGTSIMPNFSGMGDISSGEYSFWDNPLSWLSKNNPLTAPVVSTARAAGTYTGSQGVGTGGTTYGGYGYYAEGGYAYLFDGSNIWIVASPTSAAQVQVKAGTTAYNAILAQIQSGVAKKITPDILKAMRAQRKAAAPAAPSMSQQVSYSYSTPTTTMSANAPAPGGATLSAQVEEYAPWLVLGGGAIIAIGLVLTAPKKRK